MVESGDWLIPRLNGEPFAEKPILYYWLAAASSTVLGGVSPVSLRLPVLGAGVLCVLLVYLLIESYDPGQTFRYHFPAFP
jgi:4-amino-4-deoxy-L-arabinose transferase-like glycosyltransferase